MLQLLPRLSLEIAASLLACLPLYRWIERRYRSSWVPVRADAVTVARGGYRDTEVRPLAPGRAPGLVRVAAYLSLAAALATAWQFAAALALLDETRFVARGRLLAAALVLLRPGLDLLAGLLLGHAGVSLLRRGEGAAARCRGAATCAMGVGVGTLLMAAWITSQVHIGRAWIVVTACGHAAVACALAFLLLRASARLEPAPAALAVADGAPASAG